MNADFFLDTNVLVYTFTPEEPEKCGRARALVRSALQTGRGVISWQVVQEFLAVALHKFQRPLALAEAEEYRETVLSPLCRVYPSMSLYRDALLLHLETRYRFYDALIVASALAAGVGILYSEDLQDGRVIRGLRIRNPFRSRA